MATKPPPTYAPAVLLALAVQQLQQLQQLGIACQSSIGYGQKLKVDPQLQLDLIFSGTAEFQNQLALVRALCKGTVPDELVAQADKLANPAPTPTKATS